MKFIENIKKNLGLSLFILNIILLFIFIIINDPFKLFSSTYEKAPKVFNFNLNDIQKISIKFPDKNIEYELYINDSINKIKNIDEFIKNINGKFILMKDQNKEEYEIDKNRLKEFLETLIELKRYYALPDTSENRSIAGINDQSAKITIFYKNKKQDILKIGYVSIRNNSSYIQFNQEDKIYQVENNLKLKAGYEDIYYFRNHQILNLEKDKIQKITIISPNKRIVYAKAAKDWQLLEPRPASLQNSAMEGILDEIVNFKANQFYNQNKPLDKNWDNFNIKIELDIANQMDMPTKEIIHILGKKDYVKYLVEYNKQYYEVSAYRIEDLLEPEKLIETKK
jgi:hypothetical protein